MIISVQFFRFETSELINEKIGNFAAADACPHK